MCIHHYQSPIVVYSCSTNVCSTMLMKRLAYACGSIADTPSVSTRCTNTWGGGGEGRQELRMEGEGAGEQRVREEAGAARTTMALAAAAFTFHDRSDFLLRFQTCTRERRHEGRRARDGRGSHAPARNR